MHKYQDCNGTIWDLDDPNTFEKEPNFSQYLSMDAFELRENVTEEVMRALWYMQCLRPYHDGYNGQLARIIEFGKAFEMECKQHLQDVPWLRKQLFLIRDETENLC